MPLYEPNVGGGVSLGTSTPASLTSKTASVGSATDASPTDHGHSAQVSIGDAAAGDWLNRTKLTADTQFRLIAGINSSSQPEILMGPGSTTAPDVRVRRTNTKAIEIDDGAGTAVAFKVTGTIQATGQVQAGDRIWSILPNTGYNAWEQYTSGDTYNRMVIAGTGAIRWGPGNAAEDIRFYRSATNFLTVDNNAGGSATLQVMGAAYSEPLRLIHSGDTYARFLLGYDASGLPRLQMGPGGATAPDVTLHRSTTSSLDFSAGGNAGNFRIDNAAVFGRATTWDARLYRSGTKVLTVDDGASGAATLAVIGQIGYPSNSTSLTATEGYSAWQSTTKNLRIYDSQREREIGDVGWAPYAFSIGASITSAPTGTAATMAANGGSMAIPVHVPTHMLLQDVRFYIGASTTPTYELQVYRQYLNNGNAGENTLTYVSGAKRASAAGTASAINTATMVGAPVYLAPGVYWVVIRNTSATNTLIIGGTAASTWAVSMTQTKTLGSTIVDANLDFVAASWTKITGFIVPVRFSGRVFGQTTAF